jgi:uroporphyrinogen-III synthase
MPTYTVGPATAKILTDAGYKDVRGGINAGNGKVLADIILEEKKYYGFSDYVFFTGEVRRDIIPQNIRETSGAQLIEKVVYKTTELADCAKRFLISIADIQTPWIVFFSPSSANAIIQILNNKPRNCFRLAAIGPTTFAYLEKNGFTPDAVADKPNPESLLKVISKVK